MRSLVAFATTALLSLSTPALAQFDWVTVGDPGNEPFEGQPFTGQYAGRGSIPYAFRITRTELTVAQYLEFVEAYAPFFDGDPTSWELTGLFIRGYVDKDGYRFEIEPGHADAPTDLQLRMAARFCNWLHNHRVCESWAFESGVYDTSTFKDTPTFMDKYERAPDARYWIPNIDEHLKATYYGPDRYAQKKAGWWKYPGQSSIPLVIGHPDLGGETNGSLIDVVPPGVAQYPHVISPWGLLDSSGGFTEMTEEQRQFGSNVYDLEILVAHWDEIGECRPLNPTAVDYNGVRIASRMGRPSLRRHE